jgi:hypothetical protein
VSHAVRECKAVALASATHGVGTGDGGECERGRSLVHMGIQSGIIPEYLGKNYVEYTALCMVLVIMRKKSARIFDCNKKPAGFSIFIIIYNTALTLPSWVLKEFDARLTM